MHLKKISTFQHFLATSENLDSDATLANMNCEPRQEFQRAACRSYVVYATYEATDEFY